MSLPGPPLRAMLVAGLILAKAVVESWRFGGLEASVFCGDTPACAFQRYGVGVGNKQVWGGIGASPDAGVAELTGQRPYWVRLSNSPL